MKNRHSRAMAAYWLTIERRIDFLFESFPNAQDDPHEFIREYEKVFGCGFPFWYARARTEFGNVFGHDLSPEDAAWGRYKPVDEAIPISPDEQIDRMEKQMAENEPSQTTTTADQADFDDFDNEPW